MSRVGTIILALMVILWALSSFPAPPPGDPPHHYLFNVYALDKKIGLTETATGAYVMFSIRGAVLAQGRITGTYSQ